MLRSLQIENFRGLKKFSMAGLGRVNLLVGTNNCGKTSVLEAIHLLLDETIEPIIRAQLAREERLANGSWDTAQLFHGRRIQPGSAFRVHNAEVAITAEVRSIEPGEKFPNAWAPEVLASMALDVTWNLGSGRKRMPIPLDSNGGIPGSLVLYGHVAEKPVALVATAGIAPSKAAEWLGDVLLTDDEETVLAALRTIEPDLQRIAAVGLSSKQTDGRIAITVRGQRVPIGSMGDGIWRLLGVALALVRARGGVLLVDEIDTGLHYSVLEKMWKLVFETAMRLDVQVFATTHSRDCYEALAAVTQRDRHEISIQRIERDKPEAIAFDEAEIQVAAERGLEVR